MVAATFCTLPGKPRYAEEERPRLIHVRRPCAATSISHGRGNDKNAAIGGPEDDNHIFSQGNEIPEEGEEQEFR